MSDDILLMKRSISEVLDEDEEAEKNEKSLKLQKIESMKPLEVTAEHSK